MSNFDLSALAVQGCCPGNEILYDDKGMPSIMVKIPKMTYAQLGMGESTAIHPAFIVNGHEVDEIYISKYLNMINNDRAYSLGGVDPAASLNFDRARAVCENKGEGWHLMTRMEWGLLVRWCQHNGVMPKGNNSYGKDVSETSYKAIPSMARDANGRIQRTATGTGPLTWYHDQTPSGIADLKGNVGEWSGAVRTVHGELQILNNNNGADSSNGQGPTSLAWKAIKASDGTLIEPDGQGTTNGSIKLDFISNKLTYSTSLTDTATTYHSCTFANIVCDSTIGDDAKLLLQNLGMLQYGSGNELFSSEAVYWNSYEAERCFFSGGYWYNPTYGVASFDGGYARSYSYASLGFRSAYIKKPLD